MSEDRNAFIKSYWERIEEAQDYAALADLYLPESVLIDPVYGPFEGGDAIRGFLEQVTRDMSEMKVTFTVDEVAGEGDVGWSRWTCHLPDGTMRDGVSVYRFRGDRILYQHDYLGAHEL